MGYIDLLILDHYYLGCKIFYTEIWLEKVLDNTLWGF
jgi:hypothetical protein